ncbi:hypothetical protein [Paraconexibacter algicola]|uniref:Uncharacterized protein n=1 Tax=Paraconexibacter algicola TaxID=2133960 RepID=A0A2T4UE12_9ACTN|nr:hypothetical protein [Paraconexibacter algicola]PTL55748.1 hypothetical protein C7Y72_19150 [Paraconexibacter algicola]
MDVSVDATLIADAGGTSRPVRVGGPDSDFATGATGAATQTTLAAVLAELAGKLEPSDLAALATAAKQDETRAVLAAIADALAGTLTVTGSVSTGGLTDGQLRAAPVPVATGAVALDAATLAALESIQAAVAGTVALDATTLAALEQITVSGEVALTSGTLAALESVTAAVTGTVDLGAGTLAALESVTATIAGSVAVTGPLTDAQLRASAVPVSAAALPLPAGAATEATLAGRYAGGKLAAVATVTASGDTTIVTPAAGKAIRLYWITAINDPDEATSPLIRVSLGSSEVYRGYAISHWEVFTGATNAPLTVNLSGAASVAVTAHYQEITP